MFIKPRKKPLIIHQKESLLRRLLPDHKMRHKITRNLKKRKRGFDGEQNLDYHLSFLPEKDYLILTDLNLVTDGKPFQIDTLVLTPYLIFIIESKNFFGKLFLTNILSK
ncbi:nuclease-related domain-containing protein [Ammoniphilus sp. CFH 90114]|uniref:nuclease-related domain-containing protein n=1 Tax=Ammoniphilus sp. CFH 90114 TaxID=2493665 RepID=UPI00100E195F|nr:nuclease-related domain-containing protein [Ammoniphilus sp. CFH 90114]RXT05332.1 NERD domain-containing protein [Ammoniphilus sp. CFH 90114]